MPEMPDWAAGQRRNHEPARSSGEIVPASHPASAPIKKSAPDDKPSAVKELVAVDFFSNWKLPPPTGWLVGQSLAQEYVSCVIGGGSAGKTTLLLTEALALATGRELTGEYIFRRSPVVFVSFEDSEKDFHRRLTATMKHHGIQPEDLIGWFFPIMGKKLEERLVILNNGNAEPGALAPMLKAFVEKKKALALYIDPLVDAHDADENNNKHMRLVARVLSDIADERDCAVRVAHHVRKGTQEAGDADSSRGASSWSNAVRLAQSLITMTKEEATDFGVPEAEARFHVRYDNAKVNIIPPTSEARWFKFISVNLGNPGPFLPHGDNRQAIEPWTPGSFFKGISKPQVNEILADIKQGVLDPNGTPDGRRFSIQPNAAEETAAWLIVHNAFPDKNKKQCEEIIRTWIKNGLLKNEKYFNPVNRNTVHGLLFVRNP